ncbi:MULTISPECIES: DUF1761 domain-containing protein [Chryseobacterium]|uniref:DUF1761 domain-containing protein n=1 Tax=Chryseobacterium camelliae TaxID=1265445 RepID=A0ABU0TMT4_9FLAO|nr:MULTISPECIES: DUF1761 domain-containing protein [Chryseobacterium]MDT3408535.1 hypothetical protein [Pseudacidovorax intermedius]MDQ1097610.1 hypothetical protein [Chryseobacterium camelliae]MDQ1101539.1 hypothetical protein [Chryseobacterium sp. SORGH_AS_1048]MDR6084982.1 hypothetical protein [Chryseobacterium sp. SORGH_AS_0909]MDR6129336.1 hypothetical protein [Chryseobacterium sp. SORGH_AS_1175]
MEIYFNWLAVLAATAAGMAVAAIWYTKLVGKAWTVITGITTQGGNTAFVLLLISNFITAAGLNFIIGISKTYYHGNTVQACLTAGFITWIAFSAATLVQHNAFEQKPSELTLINTLYQLALYMIMAMVIGMIG